MKLLNSFRLSRIKLVSAAMVLATALAVLLVPAAPAYADCCDVSGGLSCPPTYCCYGMDPPQCYAQGSQLCQAGGTLIQCGSDRCWHFVCSFCC
jgi:hypothetical protein